MIIHLRGEAAIDAARTLAARISELRVEAGVFAEPHPDADKALQLDGRGGIAIWASNAPAPVAGRLFVLDPHDTPEFAAEKVLDALAAEGVVHLEQVGYTPEEEEALRERLAKLGYIE